MSHRLFKRVQVAAALCSVALSASAGAPESLNSEQGWSAVRQCAQRGDERARHDCLDDVLRRAGLLTPEAEASERRRQFGLGGETPTRVATPPPPPPSVPTPAAEVARTPVTPDPPDAERLQVEVAKAAKGLDGKMILTTVDGAVWVQTDSDTIQRLPAAGSRVNIRKASLGSYVCSLESRVTFRCRRTK